MAEPKPALSRTAALLRLLTDPRGSVSADTFILGYGVALLLALAGALSPFLGWALLPAALYVSAAAAAKRLRALGLNPWLYAAFVIVAIGLPLALLTASAMTGLASGGDPDQGFLGAAPARLALWGVVALTFLGFGGALFIAGDDRG